MEISSILLNQLFTNEEYRNTTGKLLIPRYFNTEPNAAKVLEVYQTLRERDGHYPSIDELSVNLDTVKGQPGVYIETLTELLEIEGEWSSQWLKNETASFLKRQATSVLVDLALDDKNGLPEIADLAKLAVDESSKIEDVLAGADKNRCSDLCDIEGFFEDMHDSDKRIPFGLELLDECTRGGLKKKEMGVVLAATGVGKSLFLCQHAASLVKRGKNVLYITLEMSEHKIRQRLFQSILNRSREEIESLEHERLVKVVSDVQQRLKGVMKIKEYPTGAAHVGDFQNLLSALKSRDGFVPDVVMVDYLNICDCKKVKRKGGVNGYEIVTAVAEELRRFAIENDVLVMTATQANREAFGKTDVNLQNTSASMGTTHTADFMFALSNDAVQEVEGHLHVAVLKNRNGPTNIKGLFSVDKSRVQIQDFDAEKSDPGLKVVQMQKTKTKKLPKSGAKLFG